LNFSFVIPAKAGIQRLFALCRKEQSLDPGFRRDDEQISK